MKRLAKKIYGIIKLLGFDPLVLWNTITGIPFYIRDFSKLKSQMGQDPTFYLGKIFPILNERFDQSGTMSGHYFHQDLLIARKVFESHPLKHVDIGSRTDGFVAHVAVFREIEVIDIRGQDSMVKNIVFTKADLMKLPDKMINYCDSISSLHALEHFGLGRYRRHSRLYGLLKSYR